MRAPLLLVRNIEALLAARREDQAALARWCYKKPSWLNKILRSSREMQFKDLDRVADFFGIAVYQLLQPGISALTERRLGADRRGGKERRLGHAQRAMLELAVEVDRVRPPVAGKGRPVEETASRSADALQRLFQKWEREFRSLNSAVEAQAPRRQTPVARRASTKAPPLARAAGGPDHPVHQSPSRKTLSRRPK